MKTNFDFKLMLPRLCFAAEIDKYRKEHRVLNYNGLIVLEANNLADYDQGLTEELQPRKGGQQFGQPPFQFRVRTQAQRQLLPVGGGIGWSKYESQTS